MSYLLDANACIALIKGEPPSVRSRMEQAVKAGATVAVSAVVAFELWYGVAKSARQAFNTQQLESLLAGPLDLVAFDDDDARAAGEIRAALEAAGTPIGAYDLLTAGQALRCGATVVTANTSEFSRVGGLRWENWA